jgi:hypothetical protein
MKAKTSVTEGIDNAPEGFVCMLRGEEFWQGSLEDCGRVGQKARCRLVHCRVNMSFPFLKPSIGALCSGDQDYISCRDPFPPQPEPIKRVLIVKV